MDGRADCGEKLSGHDDKKCTHGYLPRSQDDAGGSGGEDGGGCESGAGECGAGECESGAGESGSSDECRCG